VKSNMCRAQARMLETLTGRPMTKTEEHKDWFRVAVESARPEDLDVQRLLTLYMWAMGEWIAGSHDSYSTPDYPFVIDNKVATYQNMPWGKFWQERMSKGQHEPRAKPDKVCPKCSYSMLYHALSEGIPHAYWECEHCTDARIYDYATATDAGGYQSTIPDAPDLTEVFADPAFIDEKEATPDGMEHEPTD
jgi:hypothetical protein